MERAVRQAALPSKEESNVAKVLNYVLLDWLNRHMEFDCRADAVGPQQLFHDWQVRPLHFKCVEVIHDQHYELELVKEPRVFLMKKLTVRWLQHYTKETPNFPTIASNKDVNHSSGFYKVASEVSEDYQYLVSVEITRC